MCMHKTVMEIHQQDEIASFFLRGRTCLFVLKTSLGVEQFIDGV